MPINTDTHDHTLFNVINHVGDPIAAGRTLAAIEATGVTPSPWALQVQARQAEQAEALRNVAALERAAYALAALATSYGCWRLARGEGTPALWVLPSGHAREVVVLGGVMRLPNGTVISTDGRDVRPASQQAAA